jgi:hypothetical protein
MMSEAWVSSSLSTSSPAREVTMVGEAPPEPSGPLVRLSKPSSLCQTLTRLSPDETPI